MVERTSWTEIMLNQRDASGSNALADIDAVVMNRDFFAIVRRRPRSLAACAKAFWWADRAWMNFQAFVADIRRVVVNHRAQFSSWSHGFVPQLRCE